jgi:hypothetical protein
MPQQGRKEAKSQPNDAPRRRQREWLVYVAVSVMLAWYYAWALSAAATKSIAFDELLHVTGGYSYWKFGDFRLHGENGNLPQRWAALPLFLSDTHFPELSADEWAMPNMQAIGNAFFYASGNDADSMLRRSRAMIGLLGVALGLLVFLSARSLLGTAPALVSLGLFAFCPSTLAHGALTTSDMATTLFFTASVLGIWRVLHFVNWPTLAFSSLMIGCLFVSKFSAILIVPMGAVLLAVRLISRQPMLISFGSKTWKVDQWYLRLLIYLTTIAFQGLVVLIVIWGFYNFRYGMFATQSEDNAANSVIAANVPKLPWSDNLDESKLVGRFIAGMRDAHFLPEGYLFGFAYVLRNAGSRAAFLNGDYRLHGWPQFFPYCALVKTPITLFVLSTLAAAWIIREWYAAGETWQARAMAMGGSLYRTAPLWVLFTVYWIVAITSHLNIGHRHVLPTYPPMLILAGCSWLWVAERRSASAPSPRLTADHDRSGRRIMNWLAVRRHPLLAVAVLASLVSFATESLLNWPNYLAYFNQFIGSRTNAYRHLVDSSLDWGQDLPTLKHWLVEAGLNDSQDEKPYLSYFGTGNPDYYGIHATHLPGFWDRNPPRIPEPLRAGAYCISATIVEGMYTRFPGRWNRVYENSYQQLAQKVRQFTSSSPEKRKELVTTEGQAAWINWFQTYEHARLARLTSFLRTREPDSQINYSILIYWLSAADLDRAVNGPPIELLESADFSE